MPQAIQMGVGGVLLALVGVLMVVLSTMGPPRPALGWGRGLIVIGALVVIYAVVQGVRA